MFEGGKNVKIIKIIIRLELFSHVEKRGKKKNVILFIPQHAQKLFSAT